MTARQKCKTQQQKINEAVEAALKEDRAKRTPTTISNCEFTGVRFNEAATAAITTIAEGLVENAKALGKLASVLKASNVEIATMLRVEGPF